MPTSKRISSIAFLLVILLALLFMPRDQATHAFTGNVLLLTAHPDDECMFFAPTLRALLSAGTPVYSLCLSTGDVDGLGPIRAAELGRSLDVLGIPPTRRWVVDHLELQDNFTARWDSDTIADVLRPYIVENDISTILTFDAGGVSGHPNHRSLPDGAARLLDLHDSSIKLYTLVTWPVIAKYTGLLAPILAKSSLAQVDIYPFLDAHVTNLRRAFQLVTTPASSSEQPVGLVLAISGVADYLTALNAMRAHESQLVWFRWLYVLFSRYMWVNEWSELSIPVPSAS
ncbi:hypothetical protein DXG03_007796 [Asterophora parasitica]|uniref:N-acetylglucosaminylphosphatidylinositol deacetylase n=1 Tax=Asterophora parasitica TaxID=117018 RepID=A0A9P7GIW3_9AGAR|nr:hypothetical protein DXG03_007796 [Asterophora parasitica]